LIRPLHPPALAIDFREGLDGSDDCGSIHLDDLSMLDNVFQSSAQIAATLWEETPGVGMTVDRISGYSVCLRDPFCVPPIDPFLIDGVTLRVCAYLTVRFVTVGFHRDSFLIAH